MSKDSFTVAELREIWNFAHKDVEKFDAAGGGGRTRVEKRSLILAAIEGTIFGPDEFEG